MELRFSPKARTTKDVDLSVKSTGATLPERVKWIRTELQLAARQDRGDFFSFRVADSASELQGPTDGGTRFLIDAILADKVFARFHLDVGFNDPVLAEPEPLEGQDFLGFAGIAPPRVLAIPRSQQFAEKIHAYTWPWKDRPNTRVKDLVDLVLFLTIDTPSVEAIRDAAEQTFASRGTHPLVKELPPPPETWQSAYDEMARELNLRPQGMVEGWDLVRAFWRDLWV